MLDAEKFLKAQEYNFSDALYEIRHGKKRSCWMWYVFPQIAGLGRSFMCKKFEIKDLTEAQAYLAHPVLGERLIMMCEALLEQENNNPYEVMGPLDFFKLQSSMTLFAIAAPENPIFQQVLDKFFKGQRDPKTEMRV